MTFAQLNEIFGQIVAITGRIEARIFHKMADDLLKDEADKPKMHYHINNW